MGNKDVALMVGHGIASSGDCIEQSTMNALALETLCRTMFKAYLIGTPQRLPEGVLGAPGSRRLPGGRTRGSAGGVEGMMAHWRYYVSRAEEMLGRRIEEEES